MKPKKSQRPLGLKKETIARLDQKHQSKVLGGACTYVETGCNTGDYCPSWYPANCSIQPYCNTERGCTSFDSLCPETDTNLKCI